MKRKRRIWASGAVAVVGAALLAVHVAEPEYAYMPPARKVMNRQADFFDQSSDQGTRRVYDLWGETITVENAGKPRQAGTDAAPGPEDGAVEINGALLKLGRNQFYKETFGNEVFLTDILGIVDGPFKIRNIMKAVAQLRGKGTNNLQVELAEDITIGGKTYKKGQKIDTGLDVPKGSYVPLGLPVKYADGKLKVGITCAACHATVDPQTKMVVEGAPNADLNAGLLLAMATNSAAYFMHTGQRLSDEQVRQLQHELKRMVRTTDGRTVSLPDPDKLEAAVDADLAKWPAGNFDSTIELKNDPAQIPDCFTKGGHPYGWSGFAMAGPFHGLSAFSNNVHAQNADPLAQAEASRALFDIDKEVYIGTILQNAADPRYRYDPASGLKPSAFFAKIDPTPGVPGVNELIKPPTFPMLSLMAPDGVFAGTKGYRVGEQVNAMAAWQNTLVPPAAPISPDPVKVRMGEAVFRRAQCIRCHAGEAFTDHRIIPVDVIGTEPARAAALKKTQRQFADVTTIYAPDTPVPIPPDARVLRVPTGHLDPEQFKLAFARGDSPGGYKVKGLIGLYWSAPYLHDGGVAVGRDERTQLGVAGTLMKGIPVDPANSLRALIDRRLWREVIEANRRSPELRGAHVEGIGHEFWVDDAGGFTREQQDALVHYLLTLKSRSSDGDRPG